MKEKITFTDAKGREWHPEVTGRVIRDYEKLSGVGLFETVFNVFIEDKMSLEDAETTEPKETQVFRMARALFGNFGHLQFLLYESCRGTRNKANAVVDDMAQEVEFNDFCDAIKGESAMGAIVAAVEALFEFFPDLSDIGGKGGTTESDPEDGPGGMSSSSPPSPE
jgi:hypothetical protein